MPESGLHSLTDTVSKEPSGKRGEYGDCHAKADEDTQLLYLKHIVLPDSLEFIGRVFCQGRWRARDFGTRRRSGAMRLHITSA